MSALPHRHAEHSILWLAQRSCKTSSCPLTCTPVSFVFKLLGIHSSPSFLSIFQPQLGPCHSPCSHPATAAPCCRMLTAHMDRMEEEEQEPWSD